MASVGSVQINVALGLQRLRQDAAKAQSELSNSLKDIQVGVNVDGNKIATASTQLNTFKNQAAQGINVPVRVGTGNEIAQLAQNLASTYKEAENFARSIDLTANQANAAIASINRMNSVNATATEKFRALESELGLSKKQFRELNVAVKETDAKLKQAATGVNSFVQGIAQGIGQQAISLAFASIQKAIAGILGVIPASVKSFLELDNAIKQAGVVSGQSGESLDALRDEVSRLGRVTSKTQGDIGNLSVSLSRAGFKLEEQVDALEGIVRASEATGESLSVVGDIIGRSVRTFGLSADEAAFVGDTLVATANNTNTSIAGIGESLSYVGAVASASNQSIEDIAILIGLLGDQGIQGSQAGTNLAAALERLKIASAGGETEFSNLVKGSAKATEAFQAIGTDVRNADGSMKSLADILPVLQQNLSSLGQADKDILFKALFGVEGGRAIQALLNTTPERIAQVTDAVKNAEGVADTAGESMLQGLGGALALLQSASDAFAAELGSTFAPTVEAAVRAIIPLVSAAADLVKTFNELPAPVKATLVGFTGFVSVLVAAKGAIAVFNAAMKIATVEQVANTVATTASTVAKAANTTVTLANTKAVLGSAKAQTVATLATVKATVATRAFLATAATAAAALGVLAAAIALIGFVKLTTELRKTNDELEGFALSNNAVADGALSAAQRTKAAVDLVRQAREEGRSLTAEEKAEIEALVQANELRLSQLDEELTKLRERKKELEAQDASTPDFLGLSDGIKSQIGSLDALIGQSEKTKATLEGQTSLLQDSTTELEDNVDATSEAASAYDKLSSSINSANSQLQLNQSEQKAALAEAFAAGDINQEQYQQQVLDSEQDFLSQRLNQNRAFLTQLKDLQAVTSDPKELEQVNSQILQTEEAIAQDRLTIAENTAEERKRIEEEAAAEIQKTLDDRASTLRTDSEVATAQVDTKSNTLSAEDQVLSARSDLLTAQSAIRQNSLEQAIALAEAEDNTNKKIELRRQLQQEQRATQQAQFEIQSRQLEIQQRQRDLDLERQQILAEVAVAEAEIAIEKAIAEEASATEIANLEKILGLRQQQLAALDDQRATNEELEELEDAALEANQALEASKSSQADSKEREADAQERLNDLQDKSGDLQNENQQKSNQQAVDQAQREYDENPTRQNLEKLQNARQKAIDDEFAYRQAKVDEQNKRELEEAQAIREEAIATAQEASATYGDAFTDARADGTITDEERTTLDLLESQSEEAQKQAESANDQLKTQQKINKERQKGLDLDRKAAYEEEQRRREEEEAERRGSITGVRGEDVNVLGAARKQLQQITQQVEKFGAGRQIQELLNFAQRDSQFGGQAGQFNDILLNQLGGLGQAALNLEAIADSGQQQLARDLATQLDRAQAGGNNQLFDALLAKVTELANKPAVNTLNVSSPDPIGEAGQILRDIRKGDSQARGL